MAIKTRAQLVTAYAALDVAEPGDELVRDMVDSVGWGWVELATASPTGVSSFEFTSIPQNYTQLMLSFMNVSHDNGSNTTATLGLSTDNGSSYTNSDQALIASFSNSQLRHGFTTIDNYSLTSGIKPIMQASGANQNNSQINIWWGAYASGTTYIGFATAINAISVAMVAGNFDGGTFWLHAR